MYARDADLLQLEPRRNHRPAPFWLPLSVKLRREIQLATSRVYRLHGPTPLMPLKHPLGLPMWLKREDLSPVHSYKWRGAMNRLAQLAGTGCRHVVCASAGNHSQGVAWASNALGLLATIFMPRSAPDMKVRQTRKMLGNRGEVVQEGEAFDDSLSVAQQFADKTNAVFIPPFDDLHVIAGQGTIGLELLRQQPHPGTVYLQIGGGGMAAGVACALRSANPDIRVVGVEAEHQASMSAAMLAGKPVPLGLVDPFCDGTAVRQAGRLTHALCRELLDDLVTVSNQEVAAAIKFLWEEHHVVTEPSGAMSLAALLREHDPMKVENAVAILSGSNLDFRKLVGMAG